MALSAGETATAVAYVGVIPVFGFDDEVVGVSYFGGFDDLFHRGVFNAESDVVVERVVEKDSFLVDITHERAEVVDAHVANVDAVYGDLAVLHVVETWEEVGESGFSGARLPDKSDSGAGWDLEVDVVDNLVCAVAERYVFIADVAFEVWDSYGIIGVLDRIVGREDFVDTFHRGEPFLNGVHCFGELFSGVDDVVENHQVVNERRGTH